MKKKQARKASNMTETLLALAVFAAAVTGVISLREYFLTHKPMPLSAVEGPQYLVPVSTPRIPGENAPGYAPPAQPSYKPDFYSQTTITAGIALVISSSSPVFAYAHGTTPAGNNEYVIGMANRPGNPFHSNQITVFRDPADLADDAIVSVPHQGDIETMTYDAATDEIYFALTGNNDLEIYGFNPYSYAVWPIVSTTTINAGAKPAIVADADYIYGITNTDPSIVFKVSLTDGSLSYSSKGHIPNGHSAAIGIYGSSTELYFGGGMSDGFEKDDGATLAPLASIDVAPCSITDDMPFVQETASSGYVYLGCELAPYGYQVDTADMTTTRFPLPGETLGLFVFGSDLYNGSQDGYIDVFPGLDLDKLVRYKVIDPSYELDTHGQSIEPNELFFSTTTDSLYFTAWWGIPGLFQISTSTT